jgi:hypothetical protein
MNDFERDRLVPAHIIESIDRRIGHAAERQRAKPYTTPAVVRQMESDLQRARAQRNPEAEARDPRTKTPSVEDVRRILKVSK